MSENQHKRRADVNLRSGPQMREYVALVDRIAAGGPGLTLEWGCGWGQVSKLLIDRGVRVKAFDYREHADAPGKAPLQRDPTVEFSFSPEAVALPYEDQTFDTVLSCGVLEHVVDPEGSLDELHRVLKPGGRLYVAKLPNRTSYLERIARKMGLYYYGQLEHDTLYTVDLARRLVSEHGYRVIGARLANMLPPSIDHPVVARLSPPIWALNVALSRVPGLRRLATNVESDAIREPS